MKARPEDGRVKSDHEFSDRANYMTGLRQPLSRRGQLLAIGALVAVLAVAGAATATALTRRGGIGSLLTSSSPTAPTPPPAPLTRTRIVHLPPSTIVNGTGAIGVTLSAPAAASSPRPILRPAVPGTWSDGGNTELFTPSSTLAPCSTYTLTVWANTIATGHSRVGHRHVLTLKVACPPLAGMQQALARLGYLGAELHPTYKVHLPHGPETRREAAIQAYRPFHGRLAPDPSDAPPVEMGKLDETTKGAIEIFQADHGLEVTGVPNAVTWQKLIIVAELDHRNPQPYTWVSVTESLPETLEVHRGDHVALSTPANTGVAGAETEQGIFPIYSRFTSTTMTGTNPDGSHYSDPGVPWVNYFNGGDAVHGFIRGSYGFPQSNGCVELPVSTAAEVFPMLTLGDIVWVT
ncbi:MAG TPA: L,D-transpeptidase family protein [Solirubrobacteraceae bacterium]|jgi:peptidoglycan hydrolase-like protein with peptidoglycan-binding domain